MSIAQVLERHLIGNKKLTPRDLAHLETLHSINGAALRLVAAHQQHLAGKFSSRVSN